MVARVRGDDAVGTVLTVVAEGLPSGNVATDQAPLDPAYRRSGPTANAADPARRFTTSSIREFGIKSGCSSNQKENPKQTKGKDTHKRVLHPRTQSGRTSEDFYQ